MMHNFRQQSVCFARNSRYLIYGFYEQVRTLCAIIGANFRFERFMTVVRLALRDVEPFLHFDTFAGSGVTAGVNYSNDSERFSPNLSNSNKSTRARIFQSFARTNREISST